MQFKAAIIVYSFGSAFINWSRYIFSISRPVCGELAKANKITDANTYVCIGGKPKTDNGAGGVSMLGTVCDKVHSMRAAYVQYVTTTPEMGMTLNAEGMTKHTAMVDDNQVTFKTHRNS